MTNVLTLPFIVLKNNTAGEFISGLVQKIKTKKEQSYLRKIEELKNASYFWYLQRIFQKKQSNNRVEVDFPEFLYWTRDVINSEAKRLSEMAIEEALTLGKKHIEKSYKRLKRQLKK